MNSKARSSKYVALTILLAGFLLTRLPLLLTDPATTDVMEERVCGVLAHDLLSHRPVWNIFDYQFFPHAGGTLVVSFLVIPFFYLFGQSVVALKILPLCFSLGTLALWYLFLKRFIGRRVAVLTGILFIFAPSYFLKLNLTAALGHSEENFFSITVIYLFFTLLHNYASNQTGRISLVQSGLCGLLSGFALYCFNQVLITLCACFLFWYLIQKKFIFTKDFLWFFCFFLIGFSPWFAYNLTHNFQGPKFLTLSGSMTPFLTGSHYVDLIKKFFRLVFYNFPHSIIHDYEDNTVIIGGWIAYCFIFFLCYSLLVIQWRKGLKEISLSFFSFRNYVGEFRQSLAWIFILIFPLVYFIVYTVSKFDPVPVEITTVGIFNLLVPPFKIYRYRLFLQLYPFMFAIIALGLDYLWTCSTGKLFRAVIWVTVVFIIMLGLFSSLRMIDWKTFGKGFIYKGYDRDFYSFTIIRQSTDLYKAVKTLVLFDKEDQPKAFRLLGLKYAETVPDDVKGLLRLATTIPENNRTDFLFGYADYVVLKSLSRPDAALQFFKNIPASYRPYCYEAYGFRLCNKFFNQGINLSTIMSSLNFLEGRFLYKNLVGLHRKSDWDIPGYMHNLAEVGKDDRNFCFIGLGRFLALEAHKEQEYIRVVHTIDKASRTYVYQGFVAEKTRQFLRKAEKLFPLNCIGGNLRGLYLNELDQKYETLVTALDCIDSPFRPLAYEYAGRLLSMNVETIALAEYMQSKLNAEYRQFFLKGLQGNV